MISKVIYFVDGWVRTNIGAQPGTRDAEALARRCIDDAAKAGFTNQQLEEDLGTDLVDFFTSELKALESGWRSTQIPADAGP
jgi:hypothetical protein